MARTARCNSLTPPRAATGSAVARQQRRALPCVYPCARSHWPTCADRVLGLVAAGRSGNALEALKKNFLRLVAERENVRRGREKVSTLTRSSTRTRTRARTRTPARACARADTHTHVRTGAGAGAGAVAGACVSLCGVLTCYLRTRHICRTTTKPTSSST